jgi:hypothetical protein
MGGGWGRTIDGLSMGRVRAAAAGNGVGLEVGGVRAASLLMAALGGKRAAGQCLLILAGAICIRRLTNQRVASTVVRVPISGLSVARESTLIDLAMIGASRPQPSARVRCPPITHCIVSI